MPEGSMKASAAVKFYSCEPVNDFDDLEKLLHHVNQSVVITCDNYTYLCIYNHPEVDRIWYGFKTATEKNKNVHRIFVPHRSKFGR